MNVHLEDDVTKDLETLDEHWPQAVARLRKYISALRLAATPEREVSLEAALRRLADDKPMASFWTFEVDVRKEFARAALSPTAPNALQPAPGGEVRPLPGEIALIQLLWQTLEHIATFTPVSRIQPVMIARDAMKKARELQFDSEPVRAALNKGAV